ncbi:MAG: response regulator [Proteobacteria bacterium]|nr:response regulator [Pseudomonadota bacterium]
MSRVNQTENSDREIMVVEDNISSLKYLSNILVKEGYSVRPAVDGELALRSVRARRPDLILLDFNLPDQDGVEVCRELKSDAGTCDIPIIFTSAMSGTTIKVRALEAGAVDYVTKPLEVSEVLARIKTHLQISGLQKQLKAQSEELIAEINERKSAEKKLVKHRDHLEELVDIRTSALKESEANGRALLNATLEGAMLMKADGTIVAANESAIKRFNIASRTLVGKHLSYVAHDSISDKRDVFFKELLITKNSMRFEDSQGENFYNNSMHPILDDQGDVRLVALFFEDISDRRKAEKQVQISLREKEILLREIHHRVKNNMQVIVSLLRMHARKSGDEKLHRIFDQCRDRINAMSLIHESLYLSEDISRIDFKIYLKKLCANLYQAYNTKSKEINIIVKRCNVMLEMDQGIAVGMVICELVSNAFKHAFPNRKKGSVLISIFSNENQEVELNVKDDGIGMTTDIDTLNGSSIGMRLATATVSHELDGSLEVCHNNGTQFNIRFKCKNQGE